MDTARVVLAGLLTVWLASPAQAADPAPTSWSVDDIVHAEQARFFVLAPDGGTAFWVQSSVAEIDGEEKPVRHLWTARLDGSPPHQLTRGADRVASPRLSPDGRHLAFSSDREPTAGQKAPPEGAATQIWILPLAGGEPFRAGRFDRGVVAFDWIANDRLVAAAAESPSRAEIVQREGEDTTRTVDDAEQEPPVRLFTVGLDGEIRRLTENPRWISDLAVAPGGRHAVVSEQQSLSYGFDGRVAPHTFLVDLADGTMTRLFADGRLLPQGIAWSRDGGGFFTTDPYSRHALYRTATVSQLYWVDARTGAAERVDGDWPRGVAELAAPTGDGAALVLLADGVRHRPARYERRGGRWTRRDVEGTHAANLDALVVAGDGRTVAYQTSSVTSPPQWWTARLDGHRLVDERPITRLNPRYDGKPTGRFEVLRWTGALDEEVEGILLYPLDWREGEKRPLILDIHGGPTGTDRDAWELGVSSPNLLWRQRGAFVLQTNYHGSAGYGLDWVESIEGRYYELEIPDLLAGVDLVVARGLADPEKLATSGWSNGGILSAELITRTDRFKAAVVGAADIEWASDWANVDFGATFDNYYFKGPPWEDPQYYIDKSPFYRLTEVTTPTIVHTGTEDRNVPPHQSWSLFRALQQIGKTETRLLLYPGEPHALRKVAHQRRKVEEDLAWFDRHLFGTQAPENRALAEESPLRRALARARAARDGGVLGVRQGGALVPETVAAPGLEIGRFEVTRAQLAAFGAGDVAPRDADLPASGVSFDQARAYVAWLREATGRAFRLPTVAEAESFAAKAGRDGNTLDHWAGYTPNPEDAARLRAAAAGLPGDAPLLRPAGSFGGWGEDPVFDLDGNVAEWAVAADGTGVALGPSAERAADPRGAGDPDPAYVGLRVVVDVP